MPGCNRRRTLKCPGEDSNLKLLDIIKAQTADMCVCDGGEAPICEDTEAPPMCPDGSVPNADLGEPPAFMRNCK